MPKKNGITKTFSFDRDVVSKLDDMCKHERRTQTNLIELMIVERYQKKEVCEYGETKKDDT